MSLVEQIIEEYNLARTEPKKYIEKIEKFRSYLKGDILHVPNAPVATKTKEGIKPFNEAVEFLKKQDGLPKMVPSGGMVNIAGDFLKDIQNCEPANISRINLNKIIQKHGTFEGNFSRLMEFGGDSAERIIVNLIVSDGDPERRQRKVMFNPTHYNIGCASGTHRTFRQCTVIVCCSKFHNPNDPEDKAIFSADPTPASAPKTEPAKSSPVTAQKSEPPKPAPKPVPVSAPKTEPPKPAPKPVPVSAPKTEPPKPAGSEEPLEEGVEKVDRTEKVIIEGGKRKKLITLTKHMKDGTTKTEQFKEPFKK